ncbi:MAG: Rne/Rng family ribonuclease [Gaiellaceae bacterium]
MISVGVAEQRVAALEDGRVAEVYLERPERRSIAGNIYKGSVDNVLPGMEAAFVEIGLEKNGFLYVDEIVAPELEGKGHRRIQDLISRGQEVLVQAVKDPMKSKGARLTTEISLPGRFVVFVPHGEGFGVSRRLPDDERTRLRDIVKSLDVPTGGVIIRTAAEGASAEDVERDLVFLQRLWKTIEARAKQVPSPSLVYQEAELPLRVVRDLFTEDFVHAYVDHERTFKRIVGYLKKTSPHMVERVTRDKEKEPLFERFGVDAEICSTLSRRVDLPSGGYLIFDYAEAFTVIDVNTGRFVGSRSKSSGARLEDTITKNNLEAVKEVVRQLRLRDIGGIIVIDFIDMGSPKNRELVEEALKTELERDRTKTYVVEISPLGLVEMTRQNVTEGPREILTKRCPTCAGDGFVFSEASAAVELERRLRTLAASSRSQVYRVEMNSRAASLLIGPGAERLLEIEAQTKRRFLIEGRDDVHLDHFTVTSQGKLTDVEPDSEPAEGTELDVKLVELGLHDPAAGVAKLDGKVVIVADAARLVGKKVKARVTRVMDGVAYATLATKQEDRPAPITAEAEAEKPTRAPRGRKATAGAEAEAEVEVEAVSGAPEGEPTPADEVPAEAEPTEAVAEVEDVDAVAGAEEVPKKKTRRGSRGGRGRKRKPAAAPADGEAAEAAAETGEAAQAEAEPEAEASAEVPGPRARRRGPRIHVPPPTLGRETEPEEAGADAVSADGDAAAGAEASEDEAAPKKKRTRRGSRGGRNRRRKPAASEGAPVEDEQPEPVAEPV